MAETIKSEVRKSVNAGSAVPLTDILYRTLHHWPWVLLSLVVCVGAAVVYLLCTPKVYTTTASIMIKDEAAGKSAGAEDFGDFGLFQNKTNIQNEITTLKSADLMEEVVRRLDLDMNYYIPGRFHDVVAYGSNLPVRVEMPGFAENGSALFRVEVDGAGKVSVSDVKSGDLKSEERVQGAMNDTLMTVVGPMVVVAAEGYKPGEAVELNVVKAPVSATAGGYESRMVIAMSGDKSSVINLTVTDQSTQRAQALLSTLIGVYNEYWIRDKNQIAVSTSNFINERLGVIESELGNVDSDISSYKSQHLIPDVSAASSMYMSQNQQISQQIMDLRNQLKQTLYIKSYLGAASDNEKMLPMNSGVANVDIQSQITDYNNLVLQRNSLLAKSSDKNPLVVQLNEQMDQMRHAILASVDNSINALNMQISSLQGSQASTTSKIASNPSQAKYLLSVERQQKVKESLYLFLLQKREENELSQAFTAYNTRVVNKPASFGPTAPNTRNILMMSFLLGLAIPFGVVYLMESNNTKVRGRKDVEHLAVPFLGELPQDGHEKKKEAGEANTIVVKGGKRDIINEAFRVLRTNVEFMCNSSEGNKVIAMTSFNPGSGKSFVSMNLGMAIALKGKKVLIVDGDMRHGSTSAYMGSPAKGLADYLGGAVSEVDTLIVKTPECQNMQVLPIGSIPPNPTELLESPRFGELIGELKSRFDYVIIDCPPIEVVADAQIIDKFADRTFFVIRAGLFDRSMLPELDRLYEEKKYRNMSFILNGSRNDQGRYGYSHTYRYGYGYGYGYGYNYGGGEKKK
ncbi:polysaccharide biosynthesis tyrosine autokinase [Duncaniella sp. C9]|nr:MULTISPECIES: polysaccharide biosynthesis tyrosine autokinase [unclassified Duncaniella]QCD39760.1 polysaccharide biosynthesis tyrosine autokinase [Duncaniella sp. C9]QCP73409.1 polysaccharide biosynthesis tyrosine autokinase [Duncaniella sp. B8]